ncbi:unnamed protein product [marine sediment metagenome]|uniref:Uncharacterized protein n=1 Tax=marine sediment metagenome TaxID=412755 RepID=X1AER7_9ZZZZ
MPTAQVTICNLAMGWLGANLLTSITDEIIEGRLCRTNYDSLRDAVLEDHAWVFANARRILSPDPIAPEFGFKQRFRLPADCIRVLSANGSDRDDNQTVWVREGDFLLSNFEVLYLKYTRRVTEEALFSPNFTQAFATRIAADLCIPITESRTLQESLQGAYLYKLEGAAATDGMQGTSQRIRSNVLLGSRAGFFPGSGSFGNLGAG